MGGPWTCASGASATRTTSGWAPSTRDTRRRPISCDCTARCSTSSRSTRRSTRFRPRARSDRGATPFLNPSCSPRSSPASSPMRMRFVRPRSPSIDFSGRSASCDRRSRPSWSNSRRSCTTTTAGTACSRSSMALPGTTGTRSNSVTAPGCDRTSSRPCDGGRWRSSGTKCNT